MTEALRTNGSLRLRFFANAIFLFAVFSIIVFGLIYYYATENFSLFGIRLNEWGDFLGGIFGFPSLLVLAAAFLLQSNELQQQREEIKLTREAMQKQTVELKFSAKEAEQQNTILRNQYLIEEWKSVSNILFGISVIIYKNLRSIAIYKKQYTRGSVPGYIKDIDINRDLFVAELCDQLLRVYADPVQSASGNGQAKLLEIGLYTNQYKNIIESFLKQIEDSERIKEIFTNSPEALLAPRLVNLLTQRDEEEYS